MFSTLLADLAVVLKNSANLVKYGNFRFFFILSWVKQKQNWSFCTLLLKSALKTKKLWNMNMKILSILSSKYVQVHILFDTTDGFMYVRKNTGNVSYTWEKKRKKE